MNELHNQELVIAHQSNSRPMPASARGLWGKSQYDEVLREFFVSIQRLVDEGRIDGYRPVFEHVDDDLPPLQLAIADAVQFVNTLFGELREDSIPDLNMSFSTNWRIERQERVKAGKASRQDRKDLARFYFVKCQFPSSAPQYLERKEEAEKYFTPKEIDDLVVHQNTLWLHMSFASIFSDGEPARYYKDRFLGIAIYGLESLAKKYCDQANLHSSFFERLLLDSLMFSNLLLRIRDGFGLASNELLTGGEARRRLTNGHWGSWLRTFIFAIPGLFLLLIPELRLLGVGWLVLVFFASWRKSKSKAKSATQFNEMLRPYDLLAEADQPDGYVDAKTVRRGIEDVELKFRVFSPVCFRLLDKMMGQALPGR